MLLRSVGMRLTNFLIIIEKFCVMWFACLEYESHRTELLIDKVQRTGRQERITLVT